MPVITIANPKGGAGKTTLAMVLADTLAKNGVSVCVIDADPNSIIEKWAAKRKAAGKEMPYVVIPRPTESSMISTVTTLGQEHQFVIIDLEGAATRMASRALARSHMVLIPFNQSPIDAELAANAIALIMEEGEALNRAIPYRLVRSRDNAAIRTKTAKRIEAEITTSRVPLLNVSLVERAAYRDIYEFGAVLDELEQTPSVEKAIENAQLLAQAVVSAIREEYPNQ
jgi:chromosome partitioning protein